MNSVCGKNEEKNKPKNGLFWDECISRAGNFFPERDQQEITAWWRVLFTFLFDASTFHSVNIRKLNYFDFFHILCRITMNDRFTSKCFVLNYTKAKLTSMASTECLHDNKEKPLKFCTEKFSPLSHRFVNDRTEADEKTHPKPFQLDWCECCGYEQIKI